MSALKQIASIETGPVSEALKAEIFRLVLGTLSLPINIPGTNYHQGFKVAFESLKILTISCYISKLCEFICAVPFRQARKRLVYILRQLIEERRVSGCYHDDMLDSLLKIDDSSRGKLDDEQIIDLIIALVYSGYETVSTTSMMAVKYLHDHPGVLVELRVRQKSKCS